MIPRVVWVPDLDSLGTALARIDRATRERFEEPIGVWLRLYGHDARTALAFLDSVRRFTPRADMSMLVGMRLDLAIASGADGVHLPSHGVSIGEARSLAPGLLIGVSCHDEREVERARDADYVTVSPFASSPGKATPLGTTGLVGLVSRARPPVLALGGISLENAAAALDAAAHGVAVKRSVDEADDPHGALCAFLSTTHGRAARMSPRGSVP